MILYVFCSFNFKLLFFLAGLLDVGNLPSDLLAGETTNDQVCVECCKDNNFSGSVSSDGKMVDSGCQLSMDGSCSQNSFESDDETSSPRVSYMIRHDPEEIMNGDKCDQDTFDVQVLKRTSLVLCEVPCDGYWTKQSFRKKPVAMDSISQCSSDTGCGSEYGNEEPLDSIAYESDAKKHPFIKSTSKDSGVSTDSVCSNSLHGSISDVSEHMIEEECEYPQKIYPEQIIVSCITAH